MPFHFHSHFHFGVCVFFFASVLSKEYLSYTLNNNLCEICMNANLCRCSELCSIYWENIQPDSFLFFLPLFFHKIVIDAQTPKRARMPKSKNESSHIIFCWWCCFSYSCHLGFCLQGFSEATAGNEMKTVIRILSQSYVCLYIYCHNEINGV